MQTLFNERKRLIKQNNNIFNVFFVNILLIIILTFNTYGKEGISFLIIELFPFINTPILFGIVMSLILSEVFIVKKIDKNNKTIKVLEKRIKKLKNNQDNNTDKLQKVNDFAFPKTIQNTDNMLMDKNTTKKLVKKRF